MKLRLKAAGLTDVGQRRDHNEDHILVSDDLGLYAVADGMGGHAAGEVASHTAITAIEEYIRSHSENGASESSAGGTALSPKEGLLHGAVKAANQGVCRAAEKNLDYGGMGTTIAVVYLNGSSAYLCHVGDSRVYKFRDGHLSVLTQDHSWVNEQLQRKIISEDEARNHRWRNVITRALGNREDVEIDVGTVDAQPGDLFLVCSDGLTGMLDDAAIEEVLRGRQDDLSAACAELIRAANEAGGADNISVVIVRVEEP